MSKRKADRSKLRLPGVGGSDTRIGHIKNTATISNFFTVETSDNSLSEDEKEQATGSTGEVPSLVRVTEEESQANPRRSTRTNLSTFLPTEKRMKVNEADKKRQSNDFETANKVIKKASKIKTKTCKKQQQIIKSNFFKNEQIFSAVAAQHCLADNVNPEEMEMALALSISMTEADFNKVGIDKKQDVESEKENIRDKLKKFGFRVGDPEDYSLTAFMPVKGKAKWCNKFTALTLRNADRQLEKVNQKVGDLFSKQFSTICVDTEVCTYSVRSECLLPLVAQERIIRSDESERVNVVDFYVLSLFEPSKIRAGHLLKDVRHIAGRERSPRKTKHPPKQPATGVDYLPQSPIVKKSRSVDYPLVDALSLPGFDKSCDQEIFSSTFHTRANRQISSTGPIVVNCIGSSSTGMKDESKLSLPEKENRSQNSDVTEERPSYSYTLFTRTTSPDIFADSEGEDETGSLKEMERLQVSDSSSIDHQIATYEIFSSDEVKITSAVENVSSNLIDLTQDDSNDGSIRKTSLPPTSQKCVPNSSISFGSKFKEITSSLSNASFSKQTDVSFGNRTSKELNKSSSIDSVMQLTQPGHTNLISGSLISKFNEMASNVSCLDQIGRAMISFGSSTSEEFNKSNSIDNASPLKQWSKRSLLDTSTGVLTSKLDEMASNQSDYYNSTKSVCLDKFNCSNGVRVSFGSSTSEEFNKANSIENGSLIDRSSASVTSPFKKMVSEYEFDCSHPVENGSFDSFSCSKCAGLSFERSASGTESFKLTGTDNHVDLTQDSDCIVLSDDEVNYSILKANKSMANISIEHILNEVNEINKANIKHEFSFFRLIEDTQSVSGSQQITFDTNVKTSSNTSLDSLDLDLSKRSEFGILEEKSPFKTPTKSPKRTPKKTPRENPTTSRSYQVRKTLSESFLGSPETNLFPVTRFSSAKKFYEFTQSDDSLTDVDDIDKLVYGSPSKKIYKKPFGLDLLLTKPITTKDDCDNIGVEDTLQKFNFNGRVYLVRTKNLPHKPNFEVMDELNLGIWLDKYGLKPLKRKQAVKMLEYIYNQTHPYLVNEDEILSQVTSAKCSDVERLEDDGDLVTSHTSISKLGLKDCWGDRLVSDPGFKTEIDDEEYIFQTNTSKKILTAALPFHIAWYNLVKSSRPLHETILHYEPIDLQEIYLFFKGLGYRFDPKELRKFFDSRSIVFRYELNKNPSDGTNRHKRRCRPQKNRQTYKIVK